MSRFKRLVAILVITAIMLPYGTFAAGGKNDISNHWAKEEIEYLLGKNIVSGYPDGSFKPDKSITRAEFIKIINNAFGYSEIGQVKFTDVKKADWFYDEIGKAVAAGYINGYTDGTMKPNNPITRQEVSKIMVVVFGLSETESESANGFKDSSKIDAWAKVYVSILKDKGYISGYPDGTFRPTSPITRAEAVKIITNASGNIINAPGQYSEDESGNVLVNTTSVVLKDMEIKGDLYLTEGIGDGHVVLNNVKVYGETYIRGGGENSITIRNSNLGQVVVKRDNAKTRVVIDKDTEVSNITLNQNTILVVKENGKVESVKVVGKSNVEVGERAKVGTVEVEAKDVEIKAEGNVDSIISTEDVKINDTVVEKGKEVKVEDGKVKEVKEEEEIPVAGFSLDKIELILPIDETKSLTATVSPADATNKEVIWSSSHEEVATVDENGNVTAVSPGTATITVTTADGGFTAEATVIVPAEDTVAIIGTTEYDDLQNAIDEAEEEDTIMLVADVELKTNGLTVGADKKVTLDLAGHVISGVLDNVGASALIANNGSLTIEDTSTEKTGKITNQAANPDRDWEAGYPAYANNTITNSGMLIINGGRIENTTDGGASYVIDNNSTVRDAVVVVNDGYVVNPNKNFAIRQYANSTVYQNSVTINGGIVEGTRAVWIQLPGSSGQKKLAELIVNGGTLKSTDKDGYNLAVYSYTFGDSFEETKIIINGGIFDGDIALTGGNPKDPTETVQVNGGYFKGDYGVYSYGTMEGFISGGYFMDIEESYLKSGYTFVDSDVEGYEYMVVPVEEME